MWRWPIGRCDYANVIRGYSAVAVFHAMCGNSIESCHRTFGPDRAAALADYTAEVIRLGMDLAPSAHSLRSAHAELGQSHIFCQTGS